jgi:cyanate lyase
MTKKEAARVVQEAMQHEGVTFTDLAERLGRPPVWLAAALLGQHPVPTGDAEQVCETLGLGAEERAALEELPMRGALEDPVPTDPTIYRLYEVLQVYGPAIKALIHEEFGDGIMSAINFKLDLERVPDPAGDRVRLVLDGKFLPYQWEY